MCATLSNIATLLWQQVLREAKRASRYREASPWVYVTDAAEGASSPTPISSISAACAPTRCAPAATSPRHPEDRPRLLGARGARSLTVPRRAPYVMRRRIWTCVDGALISDGGTFLGFVHASGITSPRGRDTAL